MKARMIQFPQQPGANSTTQDQEQRERVTFDVKTLYEGGLPACYSRLLSDAPSVFRVHWPSMGYLGYFIANPDRMPVSPLSSRKRGSLIEVQVQPERGKRRRRKVQASKQAHFATLYSKHWVRFIDVAPRSGILFWRLSRSTRIHPKEPMSANGLAKFRFQYELERTHRFKGGRISDVTGSLKLRNEFTKQEIRFEGPVYTDPLGRRSLKDLDALLCPTCQRWSYGLRIDARDLVFKCRDCSERGGLTESRGRYHLDMGPYLLTADEQGGPA